MLLAPNFRETRSCYTSRRLLATTPVCQTIELMSRVSHISLYLRSTRAIAIISHKALLLCRTSLCYTYAAICYAFEGSESVAHLSRSCVMYLSQVSYSHNLYLLTVTAACTEAMFRIFQRSASSVLQCHVFAGVVRRLG
jgi:hypothetical protein